MEKRDFEENKLRELQDQFQELRKIEQSLIQVREIFLKLSTYAMQQVSQICEKNLLLFSISKRIFM